MNVKLVSFVVLLLLLLFMSLILIMEHAPTPKPTRTRSVQRNKAPKRITRRSPRKPQPIRATATPTPVMTDMEVIPAIRVSHQVECADPRIPALRRVSLGKYSYMNLGNPTAAVVSFTQSAKNLGPTEMKSIDFYNLYPISSERQEILEIEHYPQDSTFLYDNRKQKFLHTRRKNIKPGTKITTGWRAKVRTWQIVYFIDERDVGSLDDIPKDIAEECLADFKELDFYHPNIIQARDEALAGETHPLRMLQNIYNWTRRELKPGKALEDWRYPPEIVQVRKASCSESTLTFMAICRSAGIPSRWAGSIVRRGKAEGPARYEDLTNHRWPQAYLPGIGWIHCNIQSETWGRLRNSYLILTHCSGPSDILGINYRATRRTRWKGERGELELERRKVMWYTDLDDFYELKTDNQCSIFSTDRYNTIRWDTLGGWESEGKTLTLKLSRFGETVWSATGIAPRQGRVTLPMNEIQARGPHYSLTLCRSDKPQLCGHYFPIEIRQDSDGDGLDDQWEVKHWGTLASTAGQDEDHDGATNICEYYGMTDPTKGNMFEQSYSRQRRYSSIGKYAINEDRFSGVDNRIRWNRTLSSNPNSYCEYTFPAAASPTLFQGMFVKPYKKTRTGVLFVYVNDRLIHTTGRLGYSKKSQQRPMMLRVPLKAGDRLKLATELISRRDKSSTSILMPTFIDIEE
jgi:Transglutaminase-like superfamily